MSGGINKKWITPFLGVALVAGIFAVGFSSKVKVGTGPACHPVGPADPREYQKPVCEDESGMANIETFAGMLEHFDVVLPQSTNGLRFQVEDYSAWNTGTDVELYLHFTTSAQDAAAMVHDLGATASTDAFGQGSPPDEMQLGTDWNKIADWTSQFASLPEYAGLHPYVWGDASVSGGLIVDDSTDPKNPSVFVMASTDTY